MKNKKIKKLLFLILLSFFAFNGHETFAKTLTGKFEVVSEANIGNSGLPGTHIMKFTTGGISYNAYCSWYENNTPPANDKITFESANINEATAMGVASILNAGVTGTDKQQQVIKTAAVNIYLSLMKESAGKGEYHRYDKAMTANYMFNLTNTGQPFYYYLRSQYRPANDYEGLLDYFKDCGNSAFMKETRPIGLAKELCNDTNKVYYKQIYNLVNNAKIQAANYVAPTLSFDNKNEEYVQSGNYYVKTYKVSSNKNLTDIKATITGIDTTGVIITPNVAAKTITVKIPVESVKDTTKGVEVVATATVDYKKGTVYYATGVDRTIYQDLVIAGLYEDVTVSTDKDRIDVAKTCYRTKISCDTTQCVNINSNNTRTCKSVVESYEAPSCDSNDALNTASGKYTYELVSGKCSLYCTEVATVSYPGNVRPAITIGTYFAWPTTEDGLYPLTTNATLSCKIEMNANTTAADQNACINAAKNGNYKYENTKSGSIVYDNTAKSVSIPLEQNCTSSQSVNGTSVTIYNKCSYTLPTDKNIAVDKKTENFIDKVSMAVSTAYTNYILLTQHNGVLPVEGLNWSDKTKLAEILSKNDYKLEISNLALGNQGQFTSALNDNNFAYVCNYKITKTSGGSCSCPPGTEYSGYDLLGNIKTGKATNCAEAIEIYCNNGPFYCKKPDGTEVDITSCLASGKSQKECENTYCSGRVCPPGTGYAGYKFEEDAKYKACIAGGGDDDTCIDLVCNCGSNCEYSCPPDSDLYPMDITSCVYNKRGEGKNLVQALEICEKQCYQNAGSIIYRTISLENPFPSIDADKKTSQSGLTVGLFNDTIKGRYPGSNWNSSKLVKDKILNNRGYDGSAIYQEAQPLYVIELDAKAIKEIRDYNKKQIAQSDGYADFTLKCTDGAYCISSFLHNNSIRTSAGKEILTGGTCKNASNKKSFINCYKTK